MVPRQSILACCVTETDRSRVGGEITSSSYLFGFGTCNVCYLQYALSTLRPGRNGLEVEEVGFRSERSAVGAI